jgi:hypothetical protein
MSFGHDDFDESEDAIGNPGEGRYCEDCKWLTEAVRDLSSNVAKQWINSATT